MSFGSHLSPPSLLFVLLPFRHSISDSLSCFSPVEWRLEEAVPCPGLSWEMRELATSSGQSQAPETSTPHSATSLAWKARRILAPLAEVGSPAIFIAVTICSEQLSQNCTVLGT